MHKSISAPEAANISRNYRNLFGIEYWQKSLKKFLSQQDNQGRTPLFVLLGTKIDSIDLSILMLDEDEKKKVSGIPDPARVKDNKGRNAVHFFLERLGASCESEYDKIKEIILSLKILCQDVDYALETTDFLGNNALHYALKFAPYRSLSFDSEDWIQLFLTDKNLVKRNNLGNVPLYEAQDRRSFISLFKHMKNKKLLASLRNNIANLELRFFVDKFSL